MSGLYPELQPYHWAFLEREGECALYYEESGNRAGIPVVVLHGGPGSGCRPVMRRYFDPRLYRIVLLDQRGAGRSRPFGCVAGNETMQLVGDLDALREVLGIERWVLFGGSWGATLALVYALAHPDHTLALILRGVLAGRQRDRDWLFGPEGAARIYPEAYRAFVSHLPADLQGQPIEGYWARLNDQSAQTRRAAAAAWLSWEDHVAASGSNHKLPPRTVVERALIACHYARNGFFLDAVTGALPATGALDQIPGIIVHGRRDLVCPVDQALELHRRWPRAELQVEEEAGHLAADPVLERRLVQAANALSRDTTVAARL